MERLETAVKWVAVVLGVMLALWLPLVASVRHFELAAAKDLAASMWITRAESLRLMRYHGTYGLKVTHDRVYIRRDSRWIQVLERREGGPQESGGTPALPVSS